MTVNTSSRWSPTDYATNAAFVPALGSAALEMLDPQPGELILDLGCGDGTLTRKIMASGAGVIGLDASPEMVEAARAKGVDAFVADAQALDLEGQANRFGQFDAAFSNAALHWMLDPDAVAEGVFRVLKPGGRFVGEMGGQGNIAVLRGGIRDELTARGYPIPAEDPQWYPSVEEFVRLYACAGFNEIQAHLVARPTPLPAGVAGWVKTFRSGWLDVAGVPDGARDEVSHAIQARLQPLLQQADGSWSADYVRLRFTMRKPD
ncbi:class I SAM-dependent methyltransferase [Sphingosinicella sp. BN140058]|uniref:class I SAM-dependent methyltransferase n=1 Tax=Sphingosinicella sp. BN140058 TaxID=1892855 RepID=UPI001012BA26|nr:class I SAM-dependent methyltransferase [Sphingosinicella sp. BN140058]QAY79568.1 class I SAM-dependent methyltransferase [Sphingosinicella sp. BN140058]